MNNVTNSKGHLRLAYSAEASSTTATMTNRKVPDDAWDQLDLFDQPDTVIFTSPESYALPELADLLKSFHVTQVIDLRLLPHFSFGGAHRDRFIQVLSDLHVSYYSLTTIDSIANEKKGSSLIRRFLDQGPSMVFSDLDPNSDADIATAVMELNQAGIRFRPVFATLE